MARRQRPENAALWLLGTWRSNREKTLAGWIWPRGKRGAKVKEMLCRDFGKLTFRYTESRIYWRFEDRKYRWTPYRVAWSSTDVVFLVSGRGTNEEGRLLHFTSLDEYWVHAGKGIEYFCRVPTPGTSLERARGR
jgi:hypothetical protein